VHAEGLADNVVPLFRRPSTWGIVALAAAALLAVGLSALSPDEPSAPRYRDGGRPGVTSVVDGAVATPGQPLELTWSHAGAAALWEVTVSSASLAPLLTLDVTEPRAVIPAEFTAAHAGEQLLWRVQGAARDGAARAHLVSPTFTLTIAPDR
jgi:hypothetical protein